MRLSPEQQRMLREGLSGAFHQYEAFRRFLREGCNDFELNGVTDASAGLLTAFDRTIEAALGNDWIKSLLSACAAHGNPELQKVASSLLEQRANTSQLPGPIRNSRPRNVSVGLLPAGGQYFVGRQAALARLDEAWDDPQIHIITVVSWGGTGKSALIDQWLNRLQRDHYRGAEYVFGWSFSNQEDDQREDAADEFVAAALRACGDPNPGLRTTTDKAVQLIDLLRHRRVLLILDGLESLQLPHGGPTPGELKDPVLRTILRELQAENAGLCVISSRLAVRSLASWHDSTAPVLDLPELTPELGAELLKKLGVTGDWAELCQAAAECNGHALALTLLGTFLRDACGGEVARRREVSLVDAGGQAEQVLQSYESWFERDGRGAQLAVLRLLGLFDRPARLQEIAALRQGPPIAGLTDGLEGISDTEWNRCVASLRQASLLNQAKPGDSTLDAHPLVREYFGKRLRQSQEAAWRQGHSRLFDVQAQSVKPVPTSIEEIAVLHSAIAHGCAADRQKDALVLYTKRVLQERKYFSIKVLGALASDTAALSCFFDGSWDRPSTKLSIKGRAIVLDQAGEALHALGRLEEAGRSMQQLFVESDNRNDLANLGKAAITLGELHLTKGDLRSALDFAVKSVEVTDRCKNLFHRMVSRCIRGEVLNNLGRPEDAEACFVDAESIERIRKPDQPRLSSMQGFAYCDVLITLGRFQEALQRSKESIQWAKDTSALLAEGLGHLTQGRVLCMTGSTSNAADLIAAEKELALALRFLKRAGAEFKIPFAFLALAKLKVLMGQFRQARAWLEEALGMAMQSGMLLVMVDCYLELGRLTLSQGNSGEARQYGEKASSLIDQTGYARRKQDLERLAGQVSAIAAATATTVDHEEPRSTIGVEAMLAYRATTEVDETCLNVLMNAQGPIEIRYYGDILKRAALIERYDADPGLFLSKLPFMRTVQHDLRKRENEAAIRHSEIHDLNIAVNRATSESRIDLARIIARLKTDGVSTDLARRALKTFGAFAALRLIRILKRFYDVENDKPVIYFESYVFNQDGSYCYLDWAPRRSFTGKRVFNFYYYAGARVGLNENRYEYVMLPLDLARRLMLGRVRGDAETFYVWVLPQLYIVGSQYPIETFSAEDWSVYLLQGADPHEWWGSSDDPWITLSG